jgi:hypothetical protein
MTRRPRPKLGSRQRTRAQGVVEFALVLPVLLLILLVAIDFGRALYGWVVIQNSARIAANFAGLNASAWQSGNATTQQEYEQSILLDFATANCDVPAAAALPEPVFTDGPDTAVSGGPVDTNYDVGDSVVVELDCDFHLITPVIGAILGDTIQIAGRSEFRIRAGDLAGLAFPTQIPPPPTPTPTPAPTPPLVTPPPPPVPCPRPTADFSGSPTAGAGGTLTVTFSDNSTSTPACPIFAWLWDFGDGQTSTDQDPPPHLYTKTSPGSQQKFDVRLTVTVAGPVSDPLNRNNYITVGR